MPVRRPTRSNSSTRATWVRKVAAGFLPPMRWQTSNPNEEWVEVANGGIFPVAVTGLEISDYTHTQQNVHMYTFPTTQAGGDLTLGMYESALVFTGAGENRWETGLAHTPAPASREFRSVRPKLLWRKMLHTGLFLATPRGRMWPSSGLRSSWPPFGSVSRRRTCSRSPAVAATWSTSPSSRRKDRLRRSLPAKRSLASDSFSRDSLWRSSSLHCDHAPIAYEAERRLRECSRMSLDGSL